MKVKRATLLTILFFGFIISFIILAVSSNKDKLIDRHFNYRNERLKISILVGPMLEQYSGNTGLDAPVKKSYVIIIWEPFFGRHYYAIKIKEWKSAKDYLDEKAIKR